LRAQPVRTQPEDASTHAHAPEPAISQAPRHFRRARIAAFVAVFLAFLDNFAILPLIAPRASELGAGPLGVGIAVAAYSLTNLVLNLVGGSLADRFGRRGILLISLAISPLCIAAYGLATSFEMFIAFRVLHGAAGGALTAALFALLADLSPVGERGRTVGRAGAVIGVAAVLGPAVAGVAARELGTGPVFLAIALIVGVGLLLVRSAIPETLTARRRIGSDAPPEPPGTWRRLLADPRLRIAYIGIFGLVAAVGIVTGFLKDGIEARQVEAGMDAVRAARFAIGAQGGLFSVFGLVAVVVMLSPLARGVDRHGPLRYTVAGILALIGSTVILSASGAIELDTVAMVLYGLGYGLIFPATAGIVAIAAAPHERGRAYGLLNFSFDAGISTGPIVAGALLAAGTGIDPFLTATAILLIVGVLLAVAGRAAARVPDGAVAPS
jgi:MFS transporter, DHA1 family, multidrug resistance protein